MSRDGLLETYDLVLPSLEARGEAVAGELRTILAADPTLKVHSVAWRTKSRSSLARKLARPDRSYTDLWMLTDLVGVRVITYFADAVDRVGKLVEERLPVDFGHSIDKRRRETTDFGYRSLHYVCGLGGEFPSHARFEVQVRTVLEHAWAEIEHDLGYKSEDAIPHGVQRRLGRLAGLLELADQEFGAIRDELDKYARTLPARIASAGAAVPLDRFSLDALLACAEVEESDGAIASVLRRELGDDAFYPDYLLKMLASSGVHSTDDARVGVARHGDAILAMVEPYFAIAKRLWELSPDQMPRIFRGYSLFFLAHVEVLRSSTLRLEKIERLARFYRELDYPDDPKTAHHLATILVDAFEPIALAPRTG